MILKGERFPFVAMDPSLGSGAMLPFVPLGLAFGKQKVRALGLVDSAATVNVLPYELGLQVGASWEQQPAVIRLTGNLAWNTMSAFSAASLRSR